MTLACSPLIGTFAATVKDLLTAEDTPPILRERLAYCISELRDALSPDAARRLDGIEAEAVITAFGVPAAHAPDLSSGAKNRP